MFDRHNPQAGSYTLYDPEAPVITPRRPKRDTTKITLTPEQEAYLREHYHNTLNKDLAAHCGFSEGTLHRFARAMGLKKDPDWFHALVLDRCRMMAAGNRGPGNHGKKNLLIYGAKSRFKKGQTNIERHGEEKERQRIAKAAATRRETIRKERMRVNWGLPQETKLRVFQNRKASYIRHSFKRAGYILQGRCAWEAYYTADTHRIPSLEHSAQQNGITISSLFSGRLADNNKL